MQNIVNAQKQIDLGFSRIIARNKRNDMKWKRKRIRDELNNFDATNKYRYLKKQMLWNAMGLRQSMCNDKQSQLACINRIDGIMDQTIDQVKLRAQTQETQIYGGALDQSQSYDQQKMNELFNYTLHFMKQSTEQSFITSSQTGSIDISGNQPGSKLKKMVS